MKKKTIFFILIIMIVTVTISGIIVASDYLIKEVKAAEKFGNEYCEYDGKHIPPYILEDGSEVLIPASESVDCPICNRKNAVSKLYGGICENCAKKIHRCKVCGKKIK